MHSLSSRPYSPTLIGAQGRECNKQLGAMSGNLVTPSKEADCNDDQGPDDMTCQVRLHNAMLYCPQHSLTQMLWIAQVVKNQEMRWWDCTRSIVKNQVRLWGGTRSQGHSEVKPVPQIPHCCRLTSKVRLSSQQTGCKWLHRAGHHIHAMETDLRPGCVRK
jgi:hypothetical protein